MSKALINQDAAYALGEEAFKAGYEAAYNKTSGYDPYGAWSDYEPSEAVKELIAEPKPLVMQTSSGDKIEASYDPVTKIMFIKEVTT